MESELNLNEVFGGIFLSLERCGSDDIGNSVSNVYIFKSLVLRLFLNHVLRSIEADTCAPLSLTPDLRQLHSQGMFPDLCLLV